MSQELARLFFGLRLDDAARRAVAEAAGALRYEAGRLHPPENYHLTLRFLGMTDRRAIAPLCDLADGALGEPFRLTLSGSMGVFRGGRVVWAGLEPSKRLMSLQAALNESLTGMGFDDPEEPYTPHITVGRGLRLIAPLPAVRKVSFEAVRVTLFESARVDGALRYVPLNGAGA